MDNTRLYKYFLKEKEIIRRNSDPRDRLCVLHSRPSVLRGESALWEFGKVSQSSSVLQAPASMCHSCAYLRLASADTRSHGCHPLAHWTYMRVMFLHILSYLCVIVYSLHTRTMYMLYDRFIKDVLKSSPTSINEHVYELCAMLFAAFINCAVEILSIYLDKSNIYFRFEMFPQNNHHATRLRL